MATLRQKANNLLKRKPKSSKFRFVYCGDSWFDWGKTRAAEITRYRIFLGSLETAAKQKPLFILIGGDGVFYGTDAQFQYVTQIVSNLWTNIKSRSLFYLGIMNERVSTGRLEGHVSKPKKIPIVRSKQTPNKVCVGSSVLPNP